MGTARAAGIETRLRVQAFAPDGERIEHVWVTAKPLHSGKQFAADGFEPVLTIPTGTYELHAEAPGFDKDVQIVAAYAPEVLRTFSLPLGSLDGSVTPEVVGVVAGYSGVSPLLARLTGLYGNELREAIVSAGGRFKFPAREGWYLLAIIAISPRNPEIIYTKRLEVAANQSLRVQINVAGSHSPAGRLRGTRR